MSAFPVAFGGIADMTAIGRNSVENDRGASVVFSFFLELRTKGRAAFADYSLPLRCSPRHYATGPSTTDLLRFGRSTWGMNMKRNWPVIIVSVLCVTFIAGVWINNYRVTHTAEVALTK